MISLWDMLSLMVGAAAVAGGALVPQLQHTGAVGELAAWTISVLVGVGSLLAVRAVGKRIWAGDEAPQGARLMLPYWIEFASLVVMPMVTFQLVKLVLGAM